MDDKAISKEAFEDLGQILSVIAEDNASAAAEVLDAFAHLVETLLEHPFLGRVPTRTRLSQADVRVTNIPGFDKYLVFYRASPNVLS